MKIKCLTLLALVALVGLLLPLAGCQKPKENRLNLYTWSEYVPQSVIDAFEKETGIKVSMQNFSSNEEMLAKLLAGGGSYDLIQPSEYMVEALIRENLLEPLNHAEIPNLKNLAPEFRAMPFDPNNKFSVPWMAGTVGIVINTEMITEPVQTYADLFQEKHRGNIVVLDDAREAVTWALASLGYDINDINDESLAKARELLATWLPLVKVYDSDSPKTALLNGEVGLGIVWSGEGAILLNEDDKFKWVLPKEGAHMFVDSLAIPKGAKNPTAAMQFMNFILRPEISALISADFPYLNPNQEARKLLTAEQLSNHASFPTAEEMESLGTFADIGEKSAAVDEVFTSLKAR